MRSFSDAFTLRRRSLLGMGLAAALPLGAQAQSFPSRPVTLVVPFPAGGSVDLIARLYAEPLAKALGTSVVVDNRAGAGGSIASAQVARAKADGYTLVVSSQSSHLANPLTQANTGYDPIKDFASIAQLARTPNVLVVNPAVPGKTDLCRREQSIIDFDANKGGSVYVIAEDIDLFDLKYLDPQSGMWVDSWDSTQAIGQPGRLPLQARITLVLRGGPGGKTISFEEKVPLSFQQPISFAIPR